MVLCGHQQGWLWSSRSGSHRAFGSGHNLGQEGFGRRPLCDRPGRGWSSPRALPVLIEVTDVQELQVQVRVVCPWAVPCRSCALSPQGCAAQGLLPSPGSCRLVPAAGAGLQAEPEGSSPPGTSPGTGQLLSTLL